MPLHCRYCGSEYDPAARACDRCGAPKTRPARLLDQQAEPDHWSRSLTGMMVRLVLVTLVIMGVNVLMRGEGKPPIGITLVNLAWILGLVPLALAYASWHGSRPGIVRFLFCLAGSAAFWFVVVGAIVWANDPAVFAD